MKNNLPLWVIAVSLTIILISMPLQDAYAFNGLPGDTVVTRVSATSITIDSDDANCVLTVFNTADWVLTGAGAVVPTVVALTNALTCIITLTFADAGDTSSTPLVTYNTDNGSDLASDEVPGGVADDTALSATIDGAPPTFTAQTTTITTTTVTFSEAINGGNFVAGDWSVAGVTATGIAPSDAVGDETSVVLTHATIGANDTPSIQYTAGDLADSTPNLVAGNTVTASDGIAGSTGGSDDVPPSFVTTFDENEYPISIGDTKFTFAELGFNNPTTTVEIGKPIRVNLLMYDDFGPTYITQVELYTNTRGAFSGVSNSDTSIIYKKDSPRIVLDPNGFFSDVTLTSSIVNQKLQLTFDITFAKEMEKSDIIVQARDIGNNVGTLTVSDAWQVIPAQAEDTAETPPDESADDSIPGEIKVKTLNVEKPAYFMREEILFFWNR